MHVDLDTLLIALYLELTDRIVPSLGSASDRPAPLRVGQDSAVRLRQAATAPAAETAPEGSPPGAAIEHANVREVAALTEGT